LLVLKTVVLEGWSPGMDEFKGYILVDDPTKEQIRVALLNLATGSDTDRKIKSAASLVVSKIASADFPEQWPTLLPTVLQLIPTGTDGQVHGALKVLGELVEDGLAEEQYFAVARDLVTVVYDVAVGDNRQPILRALAVDTFRKTLDFLEMVKEDHKEAVQAFANETISSTWLPFFQSTLGSSLPPKPVEKSDPPAEEHFRGLVALKMQVVKVSQTRRDL
jgi:importin-9